MNAIAKTARVVSKKITQSAEGEECCMQIAGLCNHNPATTIFAHLPDETHGMGMKADELSGIYCCSSCHDSVDGRRYWQEYSDNKDFYDFRAWKRTLRKLCEKGLVKVT